MQFNLLDRIRDKVTGRSGIIVAYSLETLKTPIYIVQDSDRAMLPGGGVSTILGPNAELVEASGNDPLPPEIFSPEVGAFVRYLPDGKVYQVVKAYYGFGAVLYYVTNGLYITSLPPVVDPSTTFEILDMPIPLPPVVEPEEPEPEPEPEPEEGEVP